MRNEYDGSVLMEIQASESRIDEVIMMIERGHYVRIDRLEAETIAIREGEYSFRVKY